MSYAEEEYLQLSGIQHFLFCRRQWALIHMEQQWSENYRTIDGDILHRNVHDSDKREKRGNLLIVRAMKISSARLGLSGCAESPRVFPYLDRRGRFLSHPLSTNVARPKRICAIWHNSRRRPCVWRRCSAVKYRRAICTTAKPDIGFGWN